MITVDAGDLQATFDRLAKYPDNLRSAYQRIGLIVKGTSEKYAPKSPTKAELKADNGRRAAAVQRWRRMAKNYQPLGTRSFGPSKHHTPGALQNSIRHQAANTYVDVFVPANSPAGSYAVKMHDERYKTWTHRGIGTKRKGPQAKEKFITRAFEHHMQNGDIEKILGNELDKAMR